MIIGLYGISGVGKTTFTKKLKSRCSEIEFFSASSLIEKYKGFIDYDHLNEDVVASNQIKLLDAVNFIHINETNRIFVIELHNLIETKNGVVFIDEKVLSDLRLDRVFFIKKEPKIIKMNRDNDLKRRHPASDEEIENIQRESLSYFMRLYEGRNGSVISGSDEDIKFIVNFIKKC
ncbi:AAA family ATPase [Pectobacterium brasiliense]|uniref:AAA family ATPase n=1 Tax=Pectobacterium brasiliense TaxID=180957 RepID=UPI002405A45C|nr:AAA family ATPase [Pectobacterium brasiliense]MDG0806814.1 AAA family ATPase [Pectobacterium brasiliense]